MLGVETPQQAYRLQQRIGRHVRLEVERVEEGGSELPQIAVTTGQEIEIAVVERTDDVVRFLHGPLEHLCRNAPVDGAPQFGVADGGVEPSGPLSIAERLSELQAQGWKGRLGFKTSASEVNGRTQDAGGECKVSRERHLPRQRTRTNASLGISYLLVNRSSRQDRRFLSSYYGKPYLRV